MRSGLLSNIFNTSSWCATVEIRKFPANNLSLYVSSKERTVRHPPPTVVLIISTNEVRRVSPPPLAPCQRSRHLHGIARTSGRIPQGRPTRPSISREQRRSSSVEPRSSTQRIPSKIVFSHAGRRSKIAEIEQPEGGFRRRTFNLKSAPPR